MRARVLECMHLGVSAIVCVHVCDHVHACVCAGVCVTVCVCQCACTLVSACLYTTHVYIFKHAYIDIHESGVSQTYEHKQTQIKHITN